MSTLYVNKIYPATGSQVEFVGNLSASAIALSGDIIPGTNNTYDLGSLSNRWANIFTADLNLANERGSWTIIEESEYLSIKNNNTGKLYKFVLEEIKEHE